MKPGDLVAWTKYASEWSNGPHEGTYAGIVTRVIVHPRFDGPRRRTKVEVLDDELFMVTADMVEVISSVKTNT